MGDHYCERYDVMYNDEYEYLEKKCSDTTCEYCAKRPLILKIACRGCSYKDCQGYKKIVKKMKAK